MIKEDYVSFEVAKLLKEKGFDECCSHFYRVDGEHEYCCKAKLPRLTNNDIGNHDDWVNRVFACTCPTLQMAMKWLREKYHIVIDVCLEDYITEVDGSLTITYTYTIWHFNRHLLHTGKKDIRYTDATIDDGGEFESYEEACEAGIRYCLENWI